MHARTLAGFLSVGLACGSPSGTDEEESTGADAEAGSESESESGSGGADLPPPDHYYVFLAGPFSGDLVGQAGAASGREAAHQLCAAEHDAQWVDQLDCTTASAILATSMGGAPAGTPAELGLVPTARVLSAADDTELGTVADVFTGTLTVSLADAGLFPDGAADLRIWTGSDNGGAYGALACQDWSSADMAEQGLAGDGSATASWWSGSSVTCASEHPFVCLCH